MDPQPTSTVSTYGRNSLMSKGRHCTFLYSELSSPSLLRNKQIMQVSRASFDVVVLLVEDPVAHFVILPNYEEDETVLRETPENLGCSPSAERHMRKVSLENLWPLSFSRETHMYCLCSGSPRGSEHSGPSRASHCGDWPPPRGHTQHPVGISDSSGRDLAWNFTGMTSAVCS